MVLVAPASTPSLGRSRVSASAARLRASALFAFLVLLLLTLTGCDFDLEGAKVAAERFKAKSVAVLAAVEAEAEAAEAPPEATELDEADEEVVTLDKGRGLVRGHVLSFPHQFQTHDGEYDLVIHFHGNTDAVEESYDLANIDAVLVIINLGEGADRYERAFADPSRLRRVRRRVEDKLRARVLAQPKLRHMALSAWSAGYGAVMRIIDQPEHREVLDAVLLFDAMHANYEPGTHRVADGDVAPFERLADDAAAGKLLMFVTHSRIQPENDNLASVRETADRVLEHVGAHRSPVTGVVKPRMLKAVEGVYSHKSMIELEASSVAIQGQLFIAEYDGRSPLHHVAHLLQMSQIGLPRLMLRWKNNPSAR
ncbi:MAG: hypothetical protein KC731_41235 [Myxococcales bacterium]|nr:hypothetical protein [Myxococcales bacterium]